MEDDRKATRFELRLPPDLADEIDRWRRSRRDIPSRAEAARRLVGLGLAAFNEGANVAVALQDRAEELSPEVRALLFKFIAAIHDA